MHSIIGRLVFKHEMIVFVGHCWDNVLEAFWGGAMQRCHSAHYQTMQALDVAMLCNRLALYNF